MQDQTPQEPKPEIKTKAKKLTLPLLPKKEKRLQVTLFAIFVVFLSASAVFCYLFLQKTFSAHDQHAIQLEEKTYIYDNLTGNIIEDASLNSSPIFCIQIPNGTDGARSQAGLTEASIVFEAIAEAGITRFAAIFKNPTVSAIGPIRSLRIYYLNWDTPFNCTVTHAGGAQDALAALKSGGYRDLTENYSYMYRSSKNSTLNRRWNNLFTTPTYLASHSANTGNTSSSPKSFSRLTTFESEEEREQLTEKVAAYQDYVANPSDYDSPIESAALVTSIAIRFGNLNNFNPVYTYDQESNTYLRSYVSGVAHTSYVCPEGLKNPTPETACGEPVQIAPSVVIAMVVKEKRASDNYHEDITTIGSGKAYIFQNGTVKEGTWNKPSAAEQITFLDNSGEEIKLAPGQTWISAIPENTGSVTYK